MPRIMHIIPTLDLGGAEKQLVLLARGLVQRGLEVHVCALTRGGPREAALQECGVPLKVIGKRWKLDPLAYLRLERHVRDISPDLVHTWLFGANCYGRLAARRAGVRRIVAGERCVDRWKVGYEFLLDRMLAKWTDRIVTNSPAVRDFYAEHGICPDKFAMIPNGVETPERQLSLARGEMLSRLKLPADARLVLAAGRLWPQKNYKELIWGAHLLRVIRDDVHFLIAGDGPQRRALELYRDRVGLAGRVHFLGEVANLSELLPHVDCFWNTSRYEGQSNAILEAMAAGVPVVASDIPGNRELVVDDVTGFLTPPGDRAQLARSVRKILEDSGLARRLGEAAQVRVREHFSVERMVESHAKLYAELLADRGRNP